MHEFVAKKGLISQGNAQVSGSLTVTSGITASLFYGTASNSITASLANAISFVPANASFANSASYSVSASWSPDIITTTNYDLSQWYSDYKLIPSYTQSILVQNVTTGSGFQATIIVGDYFYGGTTFDAQNSQIFKVHTDNFNITQSAIITGSSGVSIGQFTYVKSKNKIYASAGHANVYEIDPITLSSSLVIDVGVYGGDQASSITNDGMYLYTINNIDNKIYKYSLSGFSLVASQSFTGITKFGCIDYDGVNLWVTNQGLNGIILKVNPSDFSYSSASISFPEGTTLCDDMAITPTHVFVGAEYSTGRQVGIVDKTSLSTTWVYVDNVYAIFYDNEYVWLGSSSNSYIYRIDPESLELLTYDVGYNMPNEIVGDENKLIITFWNGGGPSPIRISRIIPEKPIAKSQLNLAYNTIIGTGVTFYTNEDLTTGIFSTNEINIYSGKISNQFGSVYIDITNGNFGVGITNPTNSMDVKGNISCSIITASLFYGTSSNSITASLANAISFVPSATTSASWVSASVFITTAQTASYVTASNVVGTVTSSSFSTTASYALNISPADSASYAVTASYVATASYSQTASYISGITGSNLLYLQCSDGNTYAVTLTNYNSSIVLKVGQTPVVGTNNFLNIGNVNISNSASYSATASYSITSGVNYTTQSIIVANTQSLWPILSIPTSSYTSAIYDYSVFSGSNGKAGHINTIFLNGTASWSNIASSPIGSTSDITMSVGFSGSNVVLYANANSYLNWNVSAKAMII